MRVLFYLVVIMLPVVSFADGVREHLNVWDFELEEDEATAVGKLKVLCGEVEKKSNVYLGTECLTKHARGVPLKISLTVRERLFFSNKLIHFAYLFEKNEALSRVERLPFFELFRTLGEKLNLSEPTQPICSSEANIQLRSDRYMTDSELAQMLINRLIDNAKDKNNFSLNGVTCTTSSTNLKNLSQSINFYQFWTNEKREVSTGLAFEAIAK